MYQSQISRGRGRYETLKDSPFKRKFMETLQGNDVYISCENRYELNNPLANISNKLDEKLLEEVLFKRRERGISKDDGIKSNTCLEPKKRYILKAVKEIKLWGNWMWQNHSDWPISTSPSQGVDRLFKIGWEQNSLNKLLLNDRLFSSRKFLIFTLHSMLPTFNQRQIFDNPPRGVRKLILSTNIAETSLTIDDVVSINLFLIKNLTFLFILRCMLSIAEKRNFQILSLKRN
jgi:hypothetical protein